jgi:hypothetical protein
MTTPPTSSWASHLSAQTLPPPPTTNFSLTSLQIYIIPSTSAQILTPLRVSVNFLCFHLFAHRKPSRTNHLFFPSLYHRRLSAVCPIFQELLYNYRPLCPLHEVQHNNYRYLELDFITTCVRNPQLCEEASLLSIPSSKTLHSS